MSGREDDPPDERLDFFSEKFDPLLALNAPALRPPVPDAKPHDNVAKYWSVYNRDDAGPSGTKKTKKEKEEVKGFQRKFLPSQMPVKIEQKKVSHKNVLARMNNVRGPLEFLKKCKDERLRVKILTRHCRGIRGYCEAYVVAFDKYWNMVLGDVTEIWTRLRKTKITTVENMEKPMQIDSRRFFPEIEILKTDKKTETCKRHVYELLIRGEHVVMACIMNNKDEK